MMSELKLIYNFHSSQSNAGEFLPASYKVVFFFGEEGFIDHHQLIELAKSIPNAEHHSLNFLNLDDLKEFALRVAQEMGLSRVRLISVQDFNIGIDGAKDLKTFHDIFPKYGELVIDESASKKKGLFSKIFS